MSKFLKQKVKEGSCIPLLFSDRTPATRIWDSFPFAYTNVPAAPPPGRANLLTRSPLNPHSSILPKGAGDIATCNSLWLHTQFACRSFPPHHPANTKQREYSHAAFLFVIETRWVHGHKIRTHQFRARTHHVSESMNYLNN